MQSNTITKAPTEPNTASKYETEKSPSLKSSSSTQGPLGTYVPSQLSLVVLTSAFDTRPLITLKSSGTKCEMSEGCPNIIASGSSIVRCNQVLNLILPLKLSPALFEGKLLIGAKLINTSFSAEIKYF